MGGKKKTTDGKYVHFAVFFICLVVLVIALSLLWRVVGIYSASHFNGKAEFILGINSKNSSSIIVFLPISSRINDLHFEGEGDSKKIANILNVPIDQVVVEKSIEKNKLPNIFGLHLNIFDKLRLWFFTKSLKDNDIKFSSFNASSVEENTDSILLQFVDKTLYQEGESIAVINAGGETGKGSKIGRFLSNIGANVVVVSTADSNRSISSLEYSGEYSYTVKRLEKIFGIKAVKETLKNDSIADILLTIGKK